MRDHSGYLSEDTIAAISSAVGGAVAIVRISGPAAFTCLAHILPAAKKALAETATPKQLYLARLENPGGEKLDEALFARFAAPDSFTGENVVELHLHGGAYVTGRVLEALLTLGARQALPGEFSFRAVRNGKMTISQATAVADLIAAANDGAVTLALEKLAGTQHRLIVALAQDLRTLSALGEIGIDFSDQDVDEVSLPRLKERAAQITAALERLQNSYHRGQRIQEGVSVAFVGLPNAGKSSFFNALLGQERSIVSDVPGTTRDVVHERLTLRGRKQSVTLRLEDTAGLRATEDRVEKIGIHRTAQTAEAADLILFMIDPTIEMTAHLEQWELLGQPRAKSIAVITKTDLVSAERLRDLRAAYQPLEIAVWVETSATAGRGLETAILAITDFCGSLTHREQEEVVLTRLDHVEAVRAALADLARAENAPEIELFAADIRQALHGLSPLIGETLTDDILGQIFSEFCIGK